MSNKQDTRLLPSQQKEIGENILKCGFEPREFDWSEVDFYVSESLGLGGFHYRCSQLRHISSREYFYFKFNKSGKHYFPELSPGTDTRVMKLGEGVTWSYVIRLFGAWMELLKREISIPNFWSDTNLLAVSRSGYQFTSDIQEKFTAPEREKISEILKKVEGKLASIVQTDKEFREYVQKEFDNLRDEMKKMGKSSWWKFSLGVVANLGLAFSDKIDLSQVGGIISEQFNEILRIINTGIKSLPG